MWILEEKLPRRNNGEKYQSQEKCVEEKLAKLTKLTQQITAQKDGGHSSDQRNSSFQAQGGSSEDGMNYFDGSAKSEAQRAEGDQQGSNIPDEG